MYYRLLPLSVFLLFTTMVSAGPNGMSEAEMQKMMQQAEAAQSCFAKIDPSQYTALETKGKKMKQEIDALCKAGKSKEATAKAISYSRQMSKDPQFKQMQKCAKMMPQMAPQPYIPVEGEGDKPSDICQQ